MQILMPVNNSLKFKKEENYTFFFKLTYIYLSQLLVVGNRIFTKGNIEGCSHIFFLQS